MAYWYYAPAAAMGDLLNEESLNNRTNEMEETYLQLYACDRE